MIKAGYFIAMMAVSDKNLFIGHRLRKPADKFPVFYFPKFISYSLKEKIIERFCLGMLPDARVDIGIIGIIEPKDRAEICLGRLKQGKPVLLGLTKSLLVRKHYPFSCRLKPKKGNETKALIALSGYPVLLFIEIDSWQAVANEYFFSDSLL